MFKLTKNVWTLSVVRRKITNNINKNKTIALTILATHSLKHSWTTVHLSLKATTYSDHWDWIGIRRFGITLGSGDLGLHWDQVIRDCIGIEMGSGDLGLNWDQVITLWKKRQGSRKPSRQPPGGWSSSGRRRQHLLTPWKIRLSGVVWYFLGAFFANRIYLELGLSVVLEVLAVTKDLTSLDKGDRFPETFLLANLGVLHPRLKHLHAEISWIWFIFYGFDG